MALKVVHDKSGPSDPQENCCLCHKLTRYWYHQADVALCLECAAKAGRKDVPTKKEWLALVKAREELVKRYMPAGSKIGDVLTIQVLIGITLKASQVQSP